MNNRFKTTIEDWEQIDGLQIITTYNEGDQKYEHRVLISKNRPITKELRTIIERQIEAIIKRSNRK